MNLRYISLTGADDKTAIQDLEIMQQDYPLLEVAVLYFPERDGLARNPSISWREKFYASKVKQKAMHLCGSGINRFAEENTQLINEIKEFNRVQINLKPHYATPELVSQLTRVVEKYPEIEFITQYNDNNQDYFAYWNAVKNHTYLFDASLGKGLAPETWLAPVFNKSCGYAGGLNPQNVLDNLYKIKEVARNIPVWIDMESGVRTNDEFDLKKCREVLYKTSVFLKDY